MENSNVQQVIVSAIQVVVMVMLNAEMVQMKQVVHHVFLMDDIVQKIALLAIIHFVLIRIGFVMEVSHFYYSILNSELKNNCFILDNDCRDNR